MYIVGGHISEVKNKAVRGMTINDCTKDELKTIIERLTVVDKSRLNTILSEIAYARVKKKLDEAERWGQIADSWRQKYVNFLKKHEGKKLIDIPITEIKAADQCLKEADRADRQYNKIMKGVDAYETK